MPSELVAPNASAEPPLDAREFCQLQRRLVAGMAMRKKRYLAFGPIQDTKLRLLDVLESLDLEALDFRSALSQAVDTMGDGAATGPAQAVASDLEMDWTLAASGPGFARWLRGAAEDIERAADQAAAPRGSG